MSDEEKWENKKPFTVQRLIDALSGLPEKYKTHEILVLYDGDNAGTVIRDMVLWSADDEVDPSIILRGD